MRTTASEPPSATTLPPTEDTLPAPFTANISDDLMTSLAIAMMQQKHDDRLASDAQAAAATKAQAEAHARKIAAMHELAEDTFSEALVSGIAQGAAAVASGLGAVSRYSSDLKGIDKSANEGAKAVDLAKESAALLREANLFEAASKGLEAGGKFGAAFLGRDKELDREDMAVADADVDRAKAAADSASTASRRAQDDIRETVTAIRQYTASKTQLAQAAIFRA